MSFLRLSVGLRRPGARTASYLAPSVTGVRTWEAVRLREAEHFHFDHCCQSVLENLRRCRYSKSSTLNKIFDNVMTADQLSLAEKVLRSFRRGLGHARSGLPLVVVRACIRVGQPKKALQLVRDKVSYGLFPSPRVYTVLMDGLLSLGDAKGALAAYDQMIVDEVSPNGMVYFMAARAQAALSTSEGLTASVQHCRECSSQEPRLGTRAYTVVAKAFIEQGYSDRVVDMLGAESNRIHPQTSLNLQVHALTASGDLRQAVLLLEEKVGEKNLGLPSLAFTELQAASSRSGDSELTARLEALSSRHTAQ